MFFEFEVLLMLHEWSIIHTNLRVSYSVFHKGIQVLQFEERVASFY